MAVQSLFMQLATGPWRQRFRISIPVRDEGDPDPRVRRAGILFEAMMSDPVREIGLLKTEYAPAEIMAPAYDRIGEIATLLRALSYGEFMQLAEGIGADPGKLWTWSTSK